MTTLRRIAIADIGSNSARMVVMQRSGEFGLVPVSESKLALRLQRELSDDGHLTPEALQRLISVVRDFDAVAKSSGADRFVAIATSAIRNTSDPDEIVRRIIEETGVSLRVLSGLEEAEATFNGTVSAISVSDGAVLDIGGGSMEVIRFTDRQPEQTDTLPLGALKLSDRFFKSDVAKGVSKKELSRLQNHVRSMLTDAGVEQLSAGSTVVGTGGTVRNAAKMDRRAGGQRFGRLHGHRIGLASLEDLLTKIAALDLDSLRRVPGLNPDRADSIVGGLVVLITTIEHLGSDSVLVSGAGLREGVALQELGVGGGSVEISVVQSVRDMSSRFETWDPARASRRAAVSTKIVSIFEDLITPEIAEALRLACEVVDAGSAIDYYQRYSAAGLLVLNSNAGQLSHRQIALVNAICVAAGGSSVKTEVYGGKIAEEEAGVLQKAGVLLRLADEIEMRLPSSSADTHFADLALERLSRKKFDLRVSFTGSSDWQPSSLLRYYKIAFGAAIEVSGRSTG